MHSIFAIHPNEERRRSEKGGRTRSGQRTKAGWIYEDRQRSTGIEADRGRSARIGGEARLCSSPPICGIHEDTGGPGRRCSDGLATRRYAWIVGMSGNWRERKRERERKRVRVKGGRIMGMGRRRMGMGRRSADGRDARTSRNEPRAQLRGVAGSQPRRITVGHPTPTDQLVALAGELVARRRGS